jgi:O-antigen/teichoic acid export membrane protein
VAAGAAGVANLAMIPLWLHLYGPAAYGRYAVTWTIAIAAGAAGVGWIRQAAMRAAGTRSSLGELPAWVAPVCVAATGLVTGAGAALLGALAGVGVWAGIAMGASAAAAQLVATVLQRDDRGWRFAASETARVLVTLAVTLVLGGVLAAPVALLLGAATGNLAVLGFVPAAAWHGGTRPGALAQWWHYGWPLSAWLSLAPLVLYTDRLVLQVFATAGVVGSFAALSDLVVRGLAVLGTPLVTSGSIWAMREFNAGREGQVLGEMRRLAALCVVATLVLATGAWLLHGAVAGALGLGAVPTVCFPLLALGGGLWQAAMFAHKPLELARRTRTMLLLLVLAVVVEAGLCLLLVPAHGAAGAATALVVGVATYVVASGLASGRRRPA